MEDSIRDGEIQENTLEVKYSHLSAQEQSFWYDVETEFKNAVQSAVIKIGHVFDRVKRETSNQGARTDIDKRITYKNWVENHGYSVSQANRLIMIAKGYDQIMASNDPDKEHMLEVYVSLPKSQQELIASGKADPKRASLLLHSRDDYRYSANWLAMNEELDRKMQENVQLQNDNERLNEENAELLKRNATLERQQSESLKANAEIQNENRQLVLELEDLKEQGSTPIEVFPEDYDENKQKIVELMAEIEELQTNKNEDDKETIKDLRKQINVLKEKLIDTNSQLSVENIQKMINSFSKALTDFDVVKLQKSLERLSDSEKDLVDLFAVINHMEHKINILKRLIPGEYYEGDGSE
ncbi:hypothetical protein AB9M75_06200 [Lactobacillus sp. AN1001]